MGTRASPLGDTPYVGFGMGGFSDDLRVRVSTAAVGGLPGGVEAFARLLQGGVVGGFLLLHLFELLRVGLDVGFGSGFALAGVGEFSSAKVSLEPMLFVRTVPGGKAGLRAEQFRR